MALLTPRTPIPQAPVRTPKWRPKRVFFAADALGSSFGQQMLSRMRGLGLDVTELPGNRLPSLKGKGDRETYRLAKGTLAVVNAPPSILKLQPIPPSADWQFHLAKGCPAHCQYCYLAGSLSGPPITRVYANLPDVLSTLENYKQPDKLTTFEVSCYTDPLALEYLTGSLSECIRFFGTRENMQLRWVSKFADMESLLELEHHGNTRARVSVNAEGISQRFEGGTAPVEARVAGLRRLAEAGYPIGVVIAPIMASEGWREQYGALLDTLERALQLPCDLTFELISHRFTPGSKEVLEGWYPSSSLEMDETKRAVKRNKFGGTKYVYPNDVMGDLKGFFESEITLRFPRAKILYWT